MAQSEVQMQRKVQKYLHPDHDHAFSVRSTTDGQDGGGGSAAGGGGSSTSLITVSDRNQVVRRLHELREAQSETNLCYTLVQHRHQTQAHLLGELRRVRELLQVPPRSPLLAREDMLVVLAESSGASVQGDWAGNGGGGDCEWNGDDYCLNCDGECTNGSGCGGDRDDGGASPVSGLYQSEPYDHTLCSDCSVVCDLALDCVRRLGNMQVRNRCVDILSVGEGRRERSTVHPLPYI